MTNEKPNSSSNWRNKLDELKSIQGDDFNKETSWNKLHERLHSKSSNRKGVWYWLAAACLLFAIFISIFISNKKENVLVKNGLLKVKNNSPSSQNAPLINKHTSVFISSLSTENKMPIHAINKINTNINHKTLSTEFVQNKKEENVIREFTNNAVMPMDTAISIVANLREKKKLKIVHINELGDPVSEFPNIARYNEQHSFQFKLMNEEVYTRSSPPVTNRGFKIFTTKNILTN